MKPGLGLRSLLLLLVLSGPAGRTFAQARADTTAAPVEITFLANAGFLIRHGEVGVLIDAFVEEPYLEYGYVPAPVLESMISGDPPFHGIQYALVSHGHRDHFQPKTALRVLRNHPETLLYSSAQVALALGENPGVRTGAPLPRRWPEPERVEDERNGVHVDLFTLPHGGQAYAHVKNLGHVISLGGCRILHVGDAAMDPGGLANYPSVVRDIDVSLIPYWFFFDPGGREVIEDHLTAPVMVAVHIPPRKIEDLRERLTRESPGVLVFAEPLQTHRIPAKSAPR